MGVTAIFYIQFIYIGRPEGEEKKGETTVKNTFEARFELTKIISAPLSRSEQDRSDENYLYI